MEIIVVFYETVKMLTIGTALAAAACAVMPKPKRNKVRITMKGRFHACNKRF